MTQEQWKEANAFGADNLTWCIFGENTYAIKEELKALGCKYSPTLKWHSPAPIDLPVGYGAFSISLDELGSFDNNDKFCYKECAAALYEARLREAMGPSLSDYVGTIGQRLRDLTVTYVSAFTFESKYGASTIHTFKQDENILVWITASEVHAEVGQTVQLTGTVKAQSEYKGVKQTRLSRCIIKEVASM